MSFKQLCEFPRYIVLACIFVLCFSCKQKIKTTTKVSKKQEKELLPVFGYRFVIKGDFDGDGKSERLTEHYFSTIDKQEMNKFFDGVEDYADMVDSVIKRDPKSFILSDDKSIDTLQISSGGQLFGVSYLKNEGDLNGDGTDEVSYVIDYADFSNLNTWHIVTYKNRKWQELYQFPIWDWQLPNLPTSSNQYGLFGTENKNIDTSEDIETEWELHDWRGLVRKIQSNKIEVIYRNEEADLDTMVVDLGRFQKGER